MVYFILYLLVGFAIASISTYLDPPNTWDWERKDDKPIFIFVYIYIVFAWPVWLLVVAVSKWMQFLIRRGHAKKEKQERH